ncbi:MAG: cation transporter, partial [Gammaproteobacteria bacterium]|nr:cation transporter [Gammaproteobacteria bacterium]
MPGCNCESNVKFDGLSDAFKKALWIIIAINFFMFMIEVGASIVSNSMALRADALDFLGD